MALDLTKIKDTDVILIQALHWFIQRVTGYKAVFYVYPQDTPADFRYVTNMNDAEVLDAFARLNTQRIDDGRTGESHVPN